MTDYAKNFACNIRNLRKKHAFTQNELAEKLGYSKKTVSKWECGNCIPDVKTLFKIAELFCTDVEALFKGEQMYLLGIDGGGTKTALALADINGNILRELSVGSCNPMDLGIDAVKSILSDAIYEICADIPRSSVIMYAGIAGGVSGNMQAQLKSFFETFKFCAFKNDSDNKLIISAGIGDDDGITMILGTGVCAFTQLNGVQYKTAGWGYLIDNGGSAYNIGRDALNAYFTASDATGESTLITQEIEKMYDGIPALMDDIYKIGKKKVAEFAPVAFRAFKKGDAVAERIVLKNIDDAAHIIKTAAREFKDKNVDVVVAGGLTNEACVLEMLKAKLGARYNIRKLATAPVIGALKLAKKMFAEGEYNA